MRDWGPILVCTLLVVTMAAGARSIAGTAWNSVVNYDTSYRRHSAAVGGPRLAKRVILMTLDGLRLDRSRQLPALNQLRQKGADGIGVTGQPSLSNPGRAVMATGASSEVHGITTNFATQTVEVDSVFSLARAAGLKTAIAGIPFWYRAFGHHADQHLRTSKEPQPSDPDSLRDWQRRSCEESLTFVRQTSFDFLVLDWNAGDTASHDFGALAPATAAIYEVIDQCLGDVAASQDLRHTVLIATSDHGHIETGGHGGSEPEVITVPLVLAGGPIRAGAKISARQTDIAPTITALLGLPLPGTCEGRILLDGLDVNPSVRATLTRAQERQQQEFATFRKALLAGTVAEAAKVARRSRNAVTGTVGLGLLLLLAWVFTAVLRSSSEWRGAVLGLAAFYIVYFSLFNLQGMGYSLSTVNREEYLNRFFMTDMVLAGIGLLAANFVMGILAGQASLRLPAATTLVVSLSLALQVLFVYWSEGLWMGQWMPNLNLLFKAYLDLLAMFALPFALVLAPATVWLGARLRPRPA